MISAAQVRATRALLGWTVRELAQRAVVSIPTVNLIEDAHGLPSTIVKQMEAVQAALEAAGIEFLDGDAPGVRLHSKRSQRKR
jgi:transcriptional regulator with XRE-family HTH domain